ncbi:hypothetical protein B0H67DRAFT_483741 [Lasiosphaeris hirsuta]|uniref:ZZ-type domain-containing protein n=1 Tax=Lasiosphaeris hirsuta TaxID=260670 RepID=A0AA40ARM6_9PEZI|nr:hypothetical protein B0H67DRAFT_483741 [Lasiosphaeris hirsuta]
MASSSTVTPDTLVTIKINQNGANRRFKLPLRDLGINVLESKLREHLGIYPDVDAVFERYSDSAAAFVVLDQTNTAVYKQLNRAAKAKLKLKLRVTIREPEIAEEEEEKTGPKPASVEDGVEEPNTPDSVLPSVEEPEKSVVSPSSSTVSQSPTPAATATNTKPTEWEMRQQALAAMESTLEAIQATMAASNKLAGTIPSVSQPAAASCSAARTNYAVCCNSCDRTIPQSHYHCSTCDDGDFDLCQDCVDQGITCYGADHWLIKRFVRNGVIINSTTERIAPKQKPKAQPPVEEPTAPVPTVTAAPAAVPERIIPLFNDFLYSSIRTCNCCVQELPEVQFVHCTTCDDYDLCRACFAKNRHGHHPKHGFVSAVEGTRMEPEVSRCLAPGRNQPHNAICDGCDETIKGIRHKCLDCPDWDYCATCLVNASFIHPGHRFVPIYEPLELTVNARLRAFCRPTHVGICCDGPLCSSARTSSTYIVGDRYKCAVCNDTDFCANCEASPANTHNKTHPLIKFKTPVRHVSVTTSGEHENGRSMPAMGDRLRSRQSFTSSRSTETTAQNLATNVLTVVDVKPSESVHSVKSEEEQTKVEQPEIKVEETEQKPLVAEKTPIPEDLVAVYVRDTVADGTVLGPDCIFQQTWVLRNEGKTAWPAGCSVRYVGGDYMGHVDTDHPVSTEALSACSESTICWGSLAPGEEFPFTVLLRTPKRSGRLVSNWRLATSDGIKFGHRLWCDIVVEKPKPTDALKQVIEAVPEVKAEEVDEKEVEVMDVEFEETKTEEPEPQQSQMIFPKLEKESPVASIHEDAKSELTPSYEEEYEDCAEDDEWAESEAFMTDEEYDILDASDEEDLVGQNPKK